MLGATLGLTGEPEPTRGPSSAVVVWREGDVLLREGGSDNEVGLTIGAWVSDGQSFECRGPCRMVLLVDGGELREFVGPGRWFPVGGRVLDGALEGYREGRRLAEGAPMCLVDTTNESSPELLEPGSAVVLRPPSRIAWRGVTNARFELEVTRVSARGEPMARVERWQNLRGTVHDLTVPLEPGASYRVTLTAWTPAGSLSITREFEVLNSDERAAVAQVDGALETLAQRGGSNAEVFTVLRARMFEGYGLWDDARAIWARLAHRHPELPELASKARRLALTWQGK